MDQETRRALIAESLGYWRGAGQTNEEGNARSVEVLMTIAAAYGRGGEREARTVAALLNAGPRYTQAIIETCKEVV